MAAPLLLPATLGAFCPAPFLIPRLLRPSSAPYPAAIDPHTSKLTERYTRAADARTAQRSPPSMHWASRPYMQSLSPTSRHPRP